MISTVLANLGRWGDVALALVALAVVASGVLIARRGARGRRVAGLLALAGLAAAIALTLSPDRVGPPPSFCWVGDGIPALGDTANLALLFPVAYFATLATRRAPAVLAATAGLSALIELAQALLPALGRSCDLDDWYANTIGAVAGAAAGAVVLAVTRWRSARRDSGRKDNAGAQASGWSNT